MIQRALTFFREVRNAPVHPATAALGAVCVMVGAAVVQRYVLQQQAGLAQAWGQLRLHEQDLTALEERAATLQQRREDLRAQSADPLGPTNPADAAGDEDLDELLAQEPAR